MIDIRQHRIASGVIMVIATWVCYISFTGEPSDAYYFPRVVSVGFVILSAVTFVKALLGRSKLGEGLSMEMMKNMMPGLIVGGIYTLVLAKFLGFYVATTLSFFVLLSLYDPKANDQMKTWAKRVMVTVIFIAVMYGLFAWVLNVYTPRGLFI